MGWLHLLCFKHVFWRYSLLLFFCTLCTISVHAAIEINELMYAPSDAFGGQYNEWVELFNSGNDTINLSSCFLDGKNLPKLSITPQEYFIIARKPSLFLNNSNYSGTLIELALSLNNDLDTVTLNGTCSSQVNYTSVLGAYKNNRTLERRADGTWNESADDGGSPGKQNSIWSSVPVSSNFSTNTTLLPSPEKSCNVGLSLSGDPIINNTKLHFTLLVENKESSPLNISVKGKIETIDGKIITEYSPLTNHFLSNVSQKEYSPSIDDGVYLVTFFIENMSCVDNDNSDNTIRRIFIKNNVLSSLKNSTISLGNINLGSDKKARWGDQLSIPLTIYKSNESKNEVKVWAEDQGDRVSKTTSFLLPEKNHLSTLTIPLQLDPNCNQKIDADSIQIIAEAFGLHTEKEIPIAGISSELCKTITVEKSVSTPSSTSLSSSSSSSSSSKTRAASISIDLPPSVTAGEVIRVTAHLKGTTSRKKFSLSSYAYRGNTCYSCFNQSRDRDEALKTVTLDNQEEKDQDLFLKIDPDIDQGVLKVKVKMAQEDLKTPKEAITETYLLPAARVSSLNLTVTPLSAPSVTSKAIFSLHSSSEQPLINSGIVIYESTSSKTRNTIPYFFIAAFALISLSLIFQRK